MKRTCKRIFASALAVCLLCACIPFCAHAADACGESVYRRYDAETDSLVVYGTGATFNFDPETEIVQDTYSRVVIEAGVTHIGAYFLEGDTIGELVLPDGALTIDEDAFNSCTIERVTFPQTATDATQYGFGSEYSNFGNSIVYELDLGGLNGFPSGFRFGSGDNYDLRELIVGANITEIPDNTCNCFGSLTSLTLPDGLLSIGDGAFESCEMLQTLCIPDTVTSISNYAFDYCTGLESVTLPKDLLTIGEWAFCTCENLTSITIPAKTTTIGVSAFEGCSGLSEVKIPDSVTSIGINAFAETNLSYVHLPAGLQSIHVTSFSDTISFVCCDTEDCPVVKQFAAELGVDFRLCDGHGTGAGERVAGDSDGNGVLTLRDVVLVERYLAGGWDDIEIDEAAADVDGDGAVTLCDVVLLQRYLAGGWDVELV